MITDKIYNSFKHHRPTSDQADNMRVLRSSAHSLAELIEERCPNSREKSLAITKVEEALMWANKAIVVNE